MIRRAHRHILAPLAVIAAFPALALAAGPTSGGVGVPSGPSGATGSDAALAQPADSTVSATGNGITVRAVESGLLRRPIGFSGTAPAADAGRTVEIERSGTGAPGSWIATAQATIAPGGAFSVAWRASQSGRLAIEAVLVSPTATAAGATGGQTAPGGAAVGAGTAPANVPPSVAPAGPATAPLEITVYRPSVATFYGPGLYGHQTACGEMLHRATLGVASRTLACGTLVSILYGGQTIVVPVIDRGPYGTGANWDLTMATASALGITETSHIGTLTAG